MRRLAIETHHIDPDLQRVLAEQIPRSGRLGEVEAFNHEVHGLIRTYLESHRKEMRKIDAGLAAFMCVSTIEAVAHNTLRTRPRFCRRRWCGRWWTRR